MATQYEQARAGTITPAMQRVAEREKLPAETVRSELAAG
ncbi:MAG: phosphomethylpyrimidine synthase ThiC, partial [Planctomycetota bacterium]|nr:phosphomethylpyrimidine synthase ThiC [Planctomycetota bacterium]